MRDKSSTSIALSFSFLLHQFPQGDATNTGANQCPRSSVLICMCNLNKVFGDAKGLQSKMLIRGRLQNYVPSRVQVVNEEVLL